MSKHIDLSKAQKEEIRRLTQLANRRIKAAHRAYEKAGHSVVPKEVAGNHQIKEQWNTKSTPLSRSVKFESQQAYRKHLNYLRSFEVSRPGIKEYTSVQHDKTIQAVETSIGREAPKDLQDKLRKMTAPQLSDFWNTFSERSSKLGMKYSSNEAMQQALAEYFNEDINHLLTSSLKKAR